MANKPANKLQKDWMDSITKFINDNGLGILYDGYEGRIEMQRHHVLGRSAKHNKVHIGHWFVIPVPYELHEPNEKHEFHVGHRKNKFVSKFGKQSDIFSKMCDIMRSQGYFQPVPAKAYWAIMDTRA